jgi:PAS domain S-box-containing protein
LPTLDEPVGGLSWISTAEILESIGQAFYALDRQLRFVYINQVAERAWQRRREDLLGEIATDVFPHWAGTESYLAHQQVLRTGEPHSIETYSAIVGAPVEISIFPRTGGLAVYFHDISARKRLERELRERDEVLSLAENSAGIGVWDVDMATRLVSATPQFFRILGLPPGRGPVPIELLRSVRHPDDREHVVNNFKTALESGEDQYEAEYRIIRADDGQVRWIFGRGRIFRDASGRPVRYAGVDIDITDRKRTEEALRESEERYRTLIENANDLVFTLDLDFRITSANPAVKSLLGYTPEEMTGTQLSQYVPAEQLAKHKEMLRRKLTRETGATRYEMQVIDRNGQIRTLETNSRLSYDREGKPNAIHAISRDITERKKYEEHLSFTTRELSHRTKNVLAVVLAMVRQIGKQTESFEQFEDRFSGCIKSLAFCHDLLVESDWQGADLRNLIAMQVAPFGGLDGNKLVATGPAMTLSPQATQLIGLALHELATNAAKHGALTAPAGSVSIQWQPASGNGAARLSWREQNGPRVKPPMRRGFGHTVLERMAASLGGDVSLEFKPEGVRWTVVLDPMHIVRG